MNYLAHTLLSRHSPEAILGSLLGDFVKANADADYSDAVKEAIRTHRSIDRFTDSHATTLASRSLISPARRRFAPVMVDVFYDHFLARHWNDYCDVPLARFASTVYDVLYAYRDRLPPRMQMVAARMRMDDWLVAYADIAGMDAAINGIARRLKRFPRAAVLHGGAEELARHYETMERNFRDFFPALQRHATDCGSLERAA
jgi:acyl carrier protein phosphodiesterase